MKQGVSEACRCLGTSVPGRGTNCKVPEAGVCLCRWWCGWSRKRHGDSGPRIDRNMLVNIRRNSKADTPATSTRCPKKEVADTDASCVPNHSIFNLRMRYLSIYK